MMYTAVGRAIVTQLRVTTRDILYAVVRLLKLKQQQKNTKSELRWLKLPS